MPESKKSSFSLEKGTPLSWAVALTLGALFWWLMWAAAGPANKPGSQSIAVAQAASSASAPVRVASGSTQSTSASAAQQCEETVIKVERDSQGHELGRIEQRRTGPCSAPADTEKQDSNVVAKTIGLGLKTLVLAIH